MRGGTDGRERVRCYKVGNIGLVAFCVPIPGIQEG